MYHPFATKQPWLKDVEHYDSSYWDIDVVAIINCRIFFFQLNILDYVRAGLRDPASLPEEDE